MAKKSGLAGVAEEAGGYAGDLVEPIAMLVGGASKASVAWAAFRNIWVTKVLGPVGMLTGAALGATTAMVKLGNQLAATGMKGAASMETLTVSFKSLLKGIESAKQRMAELAQFAAKSPFRLDEIAEGSRVLETLTRGALSTEKGLKLVADAAAVTGRSFSDMANWVGRLYDGLQSGRPVGEVAMQLQAVGVISGAARTQMESLIEAGKAGNEVWAVAERELARMAGSSEALSATLDGLNSTLGDTKSMFAGAFSEGYLEGEKATVKSLADAYESLTPMARELGKEFGAVSNSWARLKAGLVANFAVPALEKFGTLIAKLGAGAAFTVLTASLLKVGQALTGLGKAGGAARSWQAAFGMMGNSAMGATKALKALALGDAAAAGAMLQTSKASAASSIAMARTAGVSGILGGALRAAGGGARFLGSMITGMLGSIIAQPIVLITAAVVGLYMAWKTYSDRQEEARKAVEGINQQMREQNALITEQLSNVRNLSDLNAHYAGVIDKLATAQRNLLQAQREADAAPYDANAQDKVRSTAATVAMLEKQARATKSVRTEQLEKDPSADQVGDRLTRAKAAQDVSFQSALEQSTPEGKARLLRERADRTAAMARAADEDERMRSDKMRNTAFAGADKGSARARLAMLKDELGQREASQEPRFMPSQSAMGPSPVQSMPAMNPAWEANVKRMEELRAAVAATEAEVKALDEEQTRASRGELERLRDLIGLIDAYNAAKKATADAEAAGDAAAAGSARGRQEALAKSLGNAGVGEGQLGNMAGLRQSLDQTLAFKTDQNKQARNNQAGQEAEAIAAAMGEVDRRQQAVLDGKQAEIAAMDEGLAKTLAMLDLEEQRIDAAAQRNLNPATPEETATAKATVEAERALALAAEQQSLSQAEIGIKETLLGLEDDTLDKQLQLLELARERLSLQKGISDEARAAAGKQIDAEEQVVRQQFSKRDAAAKLDQKDNELAKKFRGAELEQKKLANERSRIGEQKGLTDEERKAALSNVDTKEAEMNRQQSLTVKRAFMETNVSASQAREGVLASRGRGGAALRERRRRQEEERQLAQMDAEQGAEGIADPKKRKEVVKQQMEAFDDAAKADIRASRDRQSKVQAAADAYAEYIEREKDRLKLYARLSADNMRQVADANRFKLDNADALESIGIMVDKGAELNKAQANEDQAATIEENIRRQELFEGFVKRGYSQQQAGEMTRDQVNQERSARKQEQRQEQASFLLERVDELKNSGQAAVGSSMRNIGGGGGAYGPAASADNTREIKNLVAQIKDILGQEVPVLRQPERGVPYAN